MSEEKSLPIAVAEAVRRELATTNGLEELTVVGREGLQGAYTPAVPLPGLAKSLQDFLQGGVLVHAGQGVEVAFGAFAGHLSAALQGSDASPQWAPGQVTARVAFRGPIDAKVGDIVDGPFSA
jgi:hypothetical protein